MALEGRLDLDVPSGWDLEGCDEEPLVTFIQRGIRGNGSPLEDLLLYPLREEPFPLQELGKDRIDGEDLQVPQHPLGISKGKEGFNPRGAVGDDAYRACWGDGGEGGVP